jgi:hypothetical protein
VNRATLHERKRFARELAEHDRAQARDSAAAWLPPDPVLLDEEAAAAALEAARMRRWWLERYTLEEIRELGACLRA